MELGLGVWFRLACGAEVLGGGEEGVCRYATAILLV